MLVCLQRRGRSFATIRIARSRADAKRKNQKEKFQDALPKEFFRQDYFKVAERMNIPQKTAERYINHFSKSKLLHHEKKDHYMNLVFEGIAGTAGTAGIG